LPAGHPSFEGGRFCKWDLGDGTTFVGASPRHTYAQPGNYNAQWTIADQGGTVATGKHQITVVPLVKLEIECVSADLVGQWPADKSLFVRNNTGYDPAHELLIAGEDGFSFVNTAVWRVRMFVPYTDEMPRRYQEVPEHAETASYLYVDIGSARVAVIDKTTGDTVQELRMSEANDDSARIWSLAADQESALLFAIAYPDTYTPEPGWIYRWDEEIGQLSRLQFAAPERPWGTVRETMQLCIGRETDSLFVLMDLETLVTRNADEDTITLRNKKRQAIVVLDGSSGVERGRLEIPIESDVVGMFSFTSNPDTLWYATTRALVAVRIQEPFGLSTATQVPFDPPICGFTVDRETGDPYCITYKGGIEDPMLHRVDSGLGQRETIDLTSSLPSFSRSIDIQLGFARRSDGTWTVVSTGEDLFIFSPHGYSLNKKLPLRRSVQVLGLDSAGDRVVLFERAAGTVQFLGPVSEQGEPRLSDPVLLPDAGTVKQAVWDDRRSALILTYDTRLALWDPCTGTTTADIDIASAPFHKSYFTPSPIAESWSDRTSIWIASSGDISSPMFVVDWEDGRVSEGRTLVFPGGDEWGRARESQFLVDAYGSTAYMTASRYNETRICSLDWKTLRCLTVVGVDAPIISLAPRAIGDELWLLSDENLVILKGSASPEVKIESLVSLPDLLQFHGYPVAPTNRLAILESEQLAVFTAPETGDILLAPLDALVEGDT